MPTTGGSPKAKLRLSEGDTLLMDLDAPIDFTQAKTVMYYDLKPFFGRDVTVSDDAGHTFGFCAVRPGVSDEPLRPQIHFTAKRGWLNDPNGFVFYEGRWHLFFQHNPVGRGWGNMHWGHAVSDDLLHWEELDEALYPDEMGDMFSGSALVDHQNLLGLNGEHETLLLFYTAAGNGRELNQGAPYTQCLAYSTDGAKTFHKYEKNPVVAHIEADNRDPKVFFDDQMGVYYMTIYLDGDRYALLRSNTLTEWTMVCEIPLPGDRECPDFYPMTDENGARRYVMTGANNCYSVGDLDPEKGFVNASPAQKIGFGKAYAAQTCSNLPDRRVRIAWNRFTEIPARYFNCAMGIPCEMTLRDGSLRIFPVHEAADGASSAETLGHLPSHGFLRAVPCPCDLTFRLSAMEETVTVTLFGTVISLDAASGKLTVGGDVMPLIVRDGGVSLRVIADRYGIEIFDGEGAVCGAFPALPKDDLLRIGGEGSLDLLVIRSLEV